MDWNELKHRINRLIVDFTRSFGMSPNIVVLGKSEYDILQDGEAKGEYVREINDSDAMINGEIVKIWDMKVCRTDKKSLLEMGYIGKI